MTSGRTAIPNGRADLQQPTAEPLGQAGAGDDEAGHRLPADRFPALSRHAEAMISGTTAARFEFGLDLLVDGLTRHITG